MCEYDVLGSSGSQPVFPPSHVSNIANAIKDGCKFLATEHLANDVFAFCSLVNCKGARLVLGPTRWKSEVDDWEVVDRAV
jgi:hypothetical protein